MSRQVIYSIAAIMVICLATSPAAANWFGKRGNKPDLFSILLSHQSQVPATKRSDLDRVGSYTSPSVKISAVAALASIDSILQAWKQQDLGEKAVEH